MNMSTPREKIEQNLQLISLPELYFKLKELLEDSEYTMAEVALLVSQDPAMAARFLRIVNNPINRRSRQIVSISHAVSLLSVNQIRDIVLFTSITDTTERMPLDKKQLRHFWNESVYCAITTQKLARALILPESERFFVIGLCHNLGQLFMSMSIPEELQLIDDEAKKQNMPRFLLEREFLGFDYASLGADTMRKWDFPKSMQIATRFHLEPTTASSFFTETNLLHISSLLVQSDLEGAEFNAKPFQVDESLWSTVKLSKGQCQQIRQTAAEQYQKVSNSIFS
jgi:HD-like signal output (HDOD) protein